MPDLRQLYTEVDEDGQVPMLNSNIYIGDDDESSAKGAISVVT